MRDNGRAQFSARRQVIRRRVAFFQRCLSLCLLICAAYLIWCYIDSRAAVRKSQRLQEIAWQTERKTGEKTQTGGGDAIADGNGQSAADCTDAAGPDGADGQQSGGVRADHAKAAGETDENAAQDASVYMAGYEELYRINPDLRGWISIPGTAFSLPLVQCGDNEYYLTHDFYGEQDRRGTIFIDFGADLYAGQPNTLIYGHHMRDGSMFGILKEYRKETFYKEHPSFIINLPDGEREYEILAVLRNDIFEGNDEAFQYYDYKKIEDEDVFEDYCRTVKERAFYDTGVEAQPGDELVTLCTCDYGSEEQRLLVVGRRKRQ